MPHKHKRKEHDESLFDLPPSAVARSLPVGKGTQSKRTEKSEKRKRGVPKLSSYGFDDTPAAFKRLQALQQPKTHKTDIDDGTTSRPKKKRKAVQSEPKPSVEEVAEKKQELPKIMPGERLSDFAARVDHAIPISGLKAKGRNLEEYGIKERQTRMEKKMHRKYAEWRKEDERIKDQEQELRDLKEEEEAENWTGEKDPALSFGESKKSKRRKGTEEDPWAEITKKRGQRVRVSDVVQEPPKFDRIPTEKFKVKHGARVEVDNVPNKAGSLKKREELSSARKSIIEGYRRMMEEKRNN